MDGATLKVIAGSAALLIGMSVGALAYYWKRRSSAIWTIFGALTFGAAVLVLALLPRRERRHLLPQRERNWHR